MPSYSQYRIIINNFTGYTPCNGYYIYTGLTTNINNANYLNGITTLIPVVSGYSFTVTILSSISHIYLFIEHCDRHISSVPSSVPKLQGGYQIERVDLRCDDCYEPCDSCDYNIIVNQGTFIYPTPSITLTPILTPSVTPSPTITPTPTPTPSSTFIPQSGVFTVFMNFNVS